MLATRLAIHQLRENRLDYLLWIQDLLSHHTIGQPVAGIDMYAIQLTVMPASDAVTAEQALRLSTLYWRSGSCPASRWSLQV